MSVIPAANNTTAATLTDDDPSNKKPLAEDNKMDKDDNGKEDDEDSDEENEEEEESDGDSSEKDKSNIDVEEDVGDQDRVSEANAVEQLMRLGPLVTPAALCSLLLPPVEVLAQSRPATSAGSSQDPIYQLDSSPPIVVPLSPSKGKGCCQESSEEVPLPPQPSASARVDLSK